MNESEKYVLSRTLTTKKGEVLTVTVTVENTSPKKEIVQDFLTEMLSELLSNFKS